VRVVALLFVYSFLTQFNLFSGVINVPGDQQTIQNGIDISVDGDTVLVQPGTYLENINFGGKAITLGSLFLTLADTTYISQTVIDGNQEGSVVIFDNNEGNNSILTGFTIQNGAYTGGVYCNSSSPVLENLIIRNNSSVAQYFGGGVSIINSESIIENVIIENNSANAVGGGICFAGSNSTLEDVIIRDNSSTFWGGGIICENSYIDLQNVMINNNTSGNNGGGIYFTETNATLLNVIIMNNVSSWYGGGSYLSGESDIDMIDCQFSDNYAVAGGGIYVDYSNIVIDNTLIANNSSESGGGGIVFFISESSIMENVTLINNFAATMGGALYPFESNLSATCCYFIENSCGYEDNYGWGGAIYAHLSTINFYKCDILNNTANSHAGAIYLSLSLADFDKCSFIGNSSNGNVGGIYFYKSNHLDITNCTFCNNSGFDSGAMRFYIETSPTDIPVILNTISWNNSPNEILCSADGQTNELLIGYSDFDGGLNAIITNNNANILWLEGNIDTYPLFVDINNENYHLMHNSPCIDTGTTYYEYGGEVLIDLSEEEYYGIAPDMGAYEWEGTAIEEDENPCLPIFAILNQNFPNPFNPFTIISYQLSEVSDITLSVYNIKGQLVKTLINEPKPAGEHSVIWNGVDNFSKTVSSGIYHYILNVNGKIEVARKCLLLK